ncbi:MAG: nucleotidyltransferase domain-containing protein [Thiobacillaceae bacterium]|nr:nucleotidyltransferase domain-containing protein [Thiobacillaceae bacterium]
MRLSPEQTAIILAAAHRRLGADARVWLFGSRVDDAAKGGDIDLLIETVRWPDPWLQAQLKAELEQRLGLKVDLVFAAPDAPERPIHRIARLSGVLLHDRAA